MVKGICFVPNAIFVGSIDDSFMPVVKGNVDIDAEWPPPKPIVLCDEENDDDDDEDDEDEDDDVCMGGGISSGKNVNFLVCSNCICVTKILWSVFIDNVCHNQTRIHSNFKNKNNMLHEL